MALRSDSSSTLQEAAAATPGAQWQAADVRRLQLHSSRLVTGIFAGAYRSAFRGRGIEFEEVREYQPGDDVRSIDWNVTARAGRPYLKQFVEERDLTVLLLLDRSASLACPTPRGPRSRVAAEACALLALAAARSNDRVGLLTCTDRIERYLPPAKGARQARHIIAELLSGEPAGLATDLACALRYLDRVCRRPCTVCIVSDFQCADFRVPLAAAARRHHVVALELTDDSDFELPEAGLITLADPERGTRRLLDAGSPRVRGAYREQAATRRSLLLQLFAAAGVDHLQLPNGRPPIEALLRFFQAGRRAGRAQRDQGRR
jgi:uncharacterized protein (DUF58 family)